MWFLSIEPTAAARSAPAALRNRQPILDVLAPLLPVQGDVLEIASGTGEHVVHFAAALPTIRWHPSDPSSAARQSIAAHVASAQLDNVLAPLAIDAEAADWPVPPMDAIICINMAHISPWAATLGLMAGAARVLKPGGLLFLYGPWRQVGVPLTDGNAAFDVDLQARNPAWGLRLMEDAEAAARTVGLIPSGRQPMPANNWSLWFRQRPT